MADTLGGRSALRAEKNSTPGGAFRATRGKKQDPWGGVPRFARKKNSLKTAMAVYELGWPFFE